MAETIKPFLNIGPGEFIREEMEIRNWSQEDLSEILGISLKSVNHLINNKQSITLDMARLLGRAFGQSPQYWANLDSNYRLRLNNSDFQSDAVEKKSLIYRYMPVKEMIQRKWIQNVRNDDSLFQAVMTFWQIDALDFRFLEEKANLYFRKSESFRRFNSYYALTWMQMARKATESIVVKPFRKEKLRRVSDDYAEYTIKESGIPELIHDLTESGVKFIVLPHLQKTYIDGAAFWENRNPVIVYSPRYDRTDHFWFTLAHEISHVLSDISRSEQLIIDNVDEKPADAKEKRANQFASRLLKMDEVLLYFKSYRNYISESRVRACAEELSIDKSVVVGTLQHHEYLSPRNLNRLKTKVKERIPADYWVENRVQSSLQVR